MVGELLGSVVAESRRGSRDLCANYQVFLRSATDNNAMNHNGSGSAQRVTAVLAQRLQTVAIIVTAVVFVAAATGIAMGVAAVDNPGIRTTTKIEAIKQGPEQSGAPWRTWLQQYGQFALLMPNLPDVAAATAEQRAAATDLLTRTEAATAAYADPVKAQAAGYDIDASLADWERTNPWFANRMQQVDAGAMPEKMVMLHVINARPSSTVLDPNAPQALMYSYQGHNAWKLVGVVYSANGAYPGPPPVPGGPITRWHYHGFGKFGLMMHMFFVPDNDLAHAYAMEMENM
ncbi:MAG TPA: hypothetical protein VFQ37_15670 [Mycobacterium sp.]|nr:hypothetical protein [Mycobacterium sp.]